MEPDHLKGECLHPVVGWIPKGDGQVDLPKWYGLFPQHDAVERHPGRLDARSVNAHGVERFSVHDVETATSIHQYLGEPLCANDQVDHKRISSWLRDAFRVVSLIKGYGRLRPSEEGRRG